MLTTKTEAVPVPTLFEAEEYLQALLECEGNVPAELEEEFRKDLAAAVDVDKDRIEATARFIRSAEAREKACRAEVARIEDRARRFATAAQRVRKYVAGIIQTRPMIAAKSGKDKGKLKWDKLEGHTLSMSLQNGKVSLGPTDDAKIPLTYKRVTVVMPATEWRALLEAAYIPQSIIEAASYFVDRTAVKAELEAIEARDAAAGVVSEGIPGAELVAGDPFLTIR